MGKRDPRRLGRNAATLAAAAGLAMLPACGTSSPAPVEPPVEVRSTDVPAIPPTAIERLQALAKAEQGAPEAMSPTLPLPPGLDAASVAALPSDQTAPSTKAGRSLTDTVNELGSQWSPPAAPDKPQPEPSEEDRIDALANYAQARLMIQSHDTAKAIPLLQEATRLDPSAPAPWRELGQAHLALNRRAAGVAALKQAQRLGDDDSFLCYTLGREAVRVGKKDEALSLLAHALTSADPSGDPALGYLIAGELAEALLADGRLRAARDAYVGALNLPATWGTDTQFRTELADLYRRRFDLWMRVGDLSCRLGDHDAAAEAYEQAANMPALDTGLVLPRRVLAELRGGRPAGAALLVLGAIDASAGRLEDRHVELIRYLNSATSLGPSLGDALGELIGTLQNRATQSVKTRLARLRAEAQPPQAAREILLGAAIAAPTDTEAVEALIEAFPPGDAASLAPALAKIVESAPLQAPVVADALLECGRGVEETLSALAVRPEPSTRLAEAAILSHTGRLVDAAARLDKVRDTILVPELRAAWLAMRTDIAESLADSETASRCVGDLRTLAKDNTAPSIRMALAESLRARREFTEAAAIAESVGDVTHDASTYLVATDAAMRAGDGASAERTAQKALSADRFNEAVYASMFFLHSPSGPATDATKLSDAARQLRQAIPGGRLLRVLTAQDMVARDMLKDAEPILTELARQSPPDSKAVDLLATLATRAFQTDAAAATRVNAFLKSLQAQHPDSPSILAASAKADAAVGNAQAAADMLATRLSYWPLPELARARESIVRDSLKDPAKADQLAKDRLNAAPRTFANAAELAELLTRSGDLTEAARVLGEALASGAELSPEQSKAVLTLLGRLPADAPDVASAKGALALFDHLDAKHVTLTSPLLIKRLQYAMIAYEGEAAKLFDVAASIGKAAPELADTAFDLVIQKYAATKKSEFLLAFTEQVATRAEPWKPAYSKTWLSAIATWGTSDDARKLIKTLTPPDRLKAFAEMFRETFRNSDASDPTTDDARAEVAYGLGGLMLNLNRPEEAIKTYRFALELDPKYHIVKNDLGYLLLERNESLDEAAQMIEAAYAALSDNPNVIDSLGWVRYKQGRFSDRVDASGKVEEEGAVTLLARAVELSNNQDLNDAGQEHLGDALWRAGKTTDALVSWRAAAEARSAIFELYKANAPDSDRTKEEEAKLKSLKAKIDTGAAGGQPELEPLWPTK